MLNKYKITKNFTSILLFLVAFAPLLNEYIIIEIGDFSFLNTVLPTIILILLYIINIKKINLFHNLLLLFYITFVIIVIKFRQNYYSELFFEQITSQYYAFLIPIIFILFSSFSEYQVNQKYIFKLLIFILVFNFTIALLFMLGVPTIQIADTNSPDFYESGRFTGIMGGANVQGNFISTIFFLLIFYPLHKTSNYLAFIFFIMSLFSVIPTLSRLSIAGIIFSFLLFLYFKMKTKKIFLALILIILTSFLIYFFYKSFTRAYFDLFLGRLLVENMWGGRIEKMNYTIKLLISNIDSLMIGIPYNLHNNLNISISDNSLTLLAASLGIPITIFFITIIITCIYKKIKINNYSLLFSILILVISLTNNSFLWIPWVIYVALGYWLFGKVKNSLFAVKRSCNRIQPLSEQRRNSRQDFNEFLPFHPQQSIRYILDSRDS